MPQHFRRFLLACTAIFLVLQVRLQAIDAAVIISEIHYHPVAAIPSG